MKKHESNKKEPTKISPTVDLMVASEIIPEPIEWLWPNWIAKGKLHILAGMAGIGKTTIALHIAAAISSGSKLPDQIYAPKGKVLIWSGEDDIKDTLHPRLISQGSNLENIYFISTISDESGVKRSFNPAKDIAALENNIAKLGDISLIIIDPIVSVINKDSNNNGDVRKGLQPLIDLAIKHNIAILGITHFSKGSADRVPIERVTGSLAFSATARIVLVAIKDISCEGRYILAKAKANICTDHGGFYYTVQVCPLDQYPEIITSRIEWGEMIKGETTNLLSQTPDKMEKTSLVDEAKEFLVEFLSTGQQLANDVYNAAEINLITKATLRRAKDALEIESEQILLENHGKCWIWRLPKQALKSSGAQAKDLSTCKNEHLSEQNILIQSDDIK